VTGDLFEAADSLKGAATLLRSAATELRTMPDTPARRVLEADVRLLREQVVDLLLQLDEMRERRNLDVDLDPAGRNE
jgi:hypothetical protein